MHISYLPQWINYVHSPICMPCWLTNPLNILDKESRVLVIYIPEDLPEDLGAAIINEKAVCNRTKTLLYSFTAGSVAVVRKLMEQLVEVQDICKTDLRISKDCDRLSDAFKALEKAPLYIKDKVLSTSELENDVRQVLGSIENQRSRHKIIIVDDLLSLKDMVNTGDIDKKKVELLMNGLSAIAKHFCISFILMSRKPLGEFLPIKSIRLAYVTIGKKELTLQTVMSE